MIYSWLLLTLTCRFASAVPKSITASTSEDGNPITNALDGDPTTFWHSQYKPTIEKFPHVITIDLGQPLSINGFTYLPRQDGGKEGNIGHYYLDTSLDETKYKLVAGGRFPDDSSEKQVGFQPILARYIRLTATTEAGNRGDWSSAAEFGYYVAPNSTSIGQWDPVISLPLVAAASFLEPETGNVMTWASFEFNHFVFNDGVGGAGDTVSAIYHPNGTVSEGKITVTGHDMFCPGISMDFDGRAIVTGGDDAAKTSFFTAPDMKWAEGPEMNIGRGYQSQTTLSDGRTFVIGGSWSGGRGKKNAEVYDPKTNKWSLLSGCPVKPMLNADAQGVFRSDNHAWLHAWSNGSVFQAGPSKNMHWYETTGDGSVTPAGLRGYDGDAMTGVNVMYDAVAGKIFTAGGATSYQNADATANANLITLSTPGITPQVEQLPSMVYARSFANGVVLPNGKVFIVGGQPYPVPFTDTGAVLNPELWDPEANEFTILPPHDVPRTYHSVALLMLDGRIFSAGGGLCGTCSTNHEDAQIYSPAYLFNEDGTDATRPVITEISPKKLAVGDTLHVKVNSAVETFSLIRYGSATHTINTDQRRIALKPKTTSPKKLHFTFEIPSDPGIALPGYWMLFALNKDGVPSEARTVQITLQSTEMHLDADA